MECDGHEEAHLPSKGNFFFGSFAIYSIGLNPSHISLKKMECLMTSTFSLGGEWCMVCGVSHGHKLDSRYATK